MLFLLEKKEESSLKLRNTIKDFICFSLIERVFLNFSYFYGKKELEDTNLFENRMYYDEKEKKLGQFSVMCATRQR